MQLKKFRLFATSAALIGAAALTACIPPSPEPTPAPTPSPVAQPERAPPTVVTPTYDNWMDAPQTPGDWRYTASGGETSATFASGASPGETSVILACNRASRIVTLARTVRQNTANEMTIRTETQDRTIAATPRAGNAPLLVASLSATDSLLDAIAFSKGRFAIETAGAQPIFAPAYPEITRVIEDCRG